MYSRKRKILDEERGLLAIVRERASQSMWKGGGVCLELNSVMHDRFLKSSGALYKLSQ